MILESARSAGPCTCSAGYCASSLSFVIHWAFFTPERECSVWIGFLVKRCGQVTTVVAWSDSLVLRVLRIERRLNELSWSLHLLCLSSCTLFAMTLSGRTTRKRALIFWVCPSAQSAHDLQPWQRLHRQQLNSSPLLARSAESRQHK